MWYRQLSMVKEGYYFGLPPLALGAAALFLRWTFAGIILLLLAAFVFYFFRDPERIIPADPGAVVSPADGRVVVVTDEENAGRPGKRISIFLAIWNVHVNRSTAAGEITIKQIAGLIARRVVCWKKSGDRVARGERIGLVRFGSRADLWLPRDSELLVKVGDHVAGGSSVVAYWPPRAKSAQPRATPAKASSEENLSPAEKRT